MAYKVLIDFADLEDNKYVYHKGDTYPRKGLNPTSERYAELATETNKMGFALIERKAPKREKPTKSTPTKKGVKADVQSA